MGFDSERAHGMADMYEAGLINMDGSPVQPRTSSRFDVASSTDVIEVPPVRQQPQSHRAGPDAARPSAVRGRYILPNPVGGKSKSWQRVTTFVSLSADTYHLDLWKQRMVAKGIAGMTPKQLWYTAALDVKADKAKLDSIVERAREAAGANKAADRGTELHAATEDADYAGSWQDPYSILAVRPEDRDKISTYLDALRHYGLTVTRMADGTQAIERVTASQRYEVAGKLDRILTEADGSHVVADVKTKDTLDFGVTEIAAQLACYEDGINNTGIWNGREYDRSVKVRTDYGLIIHLPQNGTTCDVIKVDLSTGHEIARVCLEVRDVRRIKGASCMSPYTAPVRTRDEQDTYWLELANAASSRAELVAIFESAQSFGQWNERLRGQFSVLSKSF